MRLETKIDLLSEGESLALSLQEIHQVIQAINGQKLRCPFCAEGTLTVAEYTIDPVVWLACSSCRGQVKVRHIPEAFPERPRSAGWRIDRVTLDRQAEIW